MAARRITKHDTLYALPKSLERTMVRKKGSRSRLLKKSERLVNKQLPNKINNGYLAGETVSEGFRSH
jgi:hypothetical protein